MSSRRQESTPAGPPQRNVVYYGPDGDGHSSLEEMVQHSQFDDKPVAHEVQVVVEYVYPWANVYLDQEAGTE